MPQNARGTGREVRGASAADGDCRAVSGRLLQMAGAARDAVPEVARSAGRSLGTRRTTADGAGRAARGAEEKPGRTGLPRGGTPPDRKGNEALEAGFRGAGQISRRQAEPPERTAGRSRGGSGGVGRFAEADRRPAAKAGVRRQGPPRRRTLRPRIPSPRIPSHRSARCRGASG